MQASPSLTGLFECDVTIYVILDIVGFLTYRQPYHISRTLVSKQIVDYPQM